jgi:hypothetical protein
MGQDIELSAGDGHRLDAYLSSPTGTPRGGRIYRDRAGPVRPGGTPCRCALYRYGEGFRLQAATEKRAGHA